MIRSLKRLNSAGDTIVEVLIVLAVLGLAMSVAYATANKGLQQSRNAQEHSQALGIINSQVELLRSAYAKQGGTAVETRAAAPFCLAPPPAGSASSIQALGTGASGFKDNLAIDNLNNTTAYPGPCIQNTLYNVSITGRGNGVYDFRVRWFGLGSLGRQQEELTYKIGNVTISGGGYFNGVTPAPPLDLAFNANSGTVAAGSNITLSWTTTSATGCTASGDWSGSQPVANGSTATKNISTSSSDVGHTKNFSLTCTNSTDSITKSVSVSIQIVQPPTTTTLYRLFGLLFHHVYSTNPNIFGASPDGNVGKIDTVQGAGEQPLYHVSSYSGGASFGLLIDDVLTMDVNEKNSFLASGYVDRGIIGYIVPYGSSCPAGTQPLYRTYSTAVVDHFYTTDYNEYQTGQDSGFGILAGFYSFWGGTSGTPEGITGCTYQ